MTITEYVEKVAGIELRPYQKKILELMEQHKDDELTWVPSLGRFVFIPKEKKGFALMLHILAILSVVFGVIEYLVAEDKADQIKGLLLIILAATIM